MPVEHGVGEGEPRRFLRVVLVLLGIALGQFILYGPSLTGRKILLPLDLLADPGFYLPQTAEITKIKPKDGSLTDMVLMFEPNRRYAISEFRAGRVPRWMPYDYAGAPFNWPLFSPYLGLQCITESPVILAWSQFLLALVAGFGAYLFFRCALGTGFWPAAIGAWCYPLTGFFVIWQGFPITQPVSLLPWLLLAVDRTVRDTSPLAPIALAAATCLVLNGQLDVAGQVLLVSGLYGVWTWCAGYFRDLRRVPGDVGALGQFDLPSHPCPESLKPTCQRAGRSAARLAAGWVLGLLLAAPYILPVLDYSHTGVRMARRSAGTEERPPIGLTALPQIVLPDMYGTRRPPSLRYAGGPVQQESSASAYAGLVATLLAAPLAFGSKRRRTSSILWVLLSVLGCAWCLNIPGLVSLLRLPGLNMMSHNRLVFITCFAILVLAVNGLQALLEESVSWRRWMWLPFATLAGLCTWCAYRTVFLPESIATGIAQVVSRGDAADWIHDSNGVRLAQAWFVQYYAEAAFCGGLGVVGWVLLRSRRLRPVRLVAFLGVLLVGELIWSGYGRNVQSDPTLYYPPVPVLQSLAKATAGRIIGFGCLPAPLATICKLRDIRGYDGVEPARLVELVMSAAEPISRKPRYAVTMQVAPKATITPEGDIQLPPVLDMLGVRYVIFRGLPFPKTHPVFQGEDYWVLQNPRALPRVYVPENVEVITDDSVRLQKLESPEFNPRIMAYVETPVILPNPCRGTADIVDEIPTRINVQARMETPGLVVLSDLWDRGWHAYVNGKQIPILRANHAVRGVVLPAGSHNLQFRYEPVSFVWGLRSAGFAMAVLLSWLGIGLWRGYRTSSKPASAPDAPSPTGASWRHR